MDVVDQPGEKSAIYFSPKDWSINRPVEMFWEVQMHGTVGQDL